MNEIMKFCKFCVIYKPWLINDTLKEKEVERKEEEKI